MKLDSGKIVLSEEKTECVEIEAQPPSSTAVAMAKAEGKSD